MTSKTPHEIDIEVGTKVCHYRRARGISQAQLGETLGITFQQVQKYEKGTNRISASKLVLIARALRVPAAVLLPADKHECTGSADLIAQNNQLQSKLDEIRRLVA